MSLQVWLPLTKDLRQQGLGNITVTNNGATYNNTGGKLGGCYSFDGVDDAITIGNLSTLVTDTFSFSCWFYHNENWSSKNWETIFGGPSGFELESKNGSTNSPIIYAYSWGKGSFAYELSKWNHLVMTRTTSETKFYLNGELKLTGMAGSIPSGNYFIGSWSSTTGQNFRGKINDVRIYDHCLSPMEVKELAKGLVLHYPLSDNSIQQLNNCYTNPTFNSSSASAGWSHWGSSGHQGTYGQNTNSNYIYRANQSYSHWVADGIDATKNYLVYQSPAFEGGQRSLQCICKEENSLPINESIVYPAWNARNGGAISNQWTSITSLGNGFYYCKCENIQQSGSDDLVGFYVRPGYKVYFSEAYLENDKECCSDIFYPTTTIYDCSGFCNNGTISGNLTISNDTPKYSVSTQFNGTQYVETLDEISTTDSTIAAWVNTTLAANGFILDCRNSSGSGKQPIYQYTNGSIQAGGSGKYVTTSTGLLVANTWIHLAIVQDGDSILVYKNGQLFQTISCTNSPIIKPVLGARYTHGNGFSGLLSDLRIYATALSADDVKSLYQNSAYIDSSGNVYGAVHSEV